MTSRIRFADAGDVFDAFPRLSMVAPRPAAPIEPLDYARQRSASPTPVGALAFLAHLLPRREAVWWGCQCLSAMLGAAAAKDEGLRLATQWVRDPDEAVRRDALAYSQSSTGGTPGGWLARAVGYSGGSILGPDQPPMAPDLDACAMSVNAALVLAATVQPPIAVLPWLRSCAEAGVRFAAGEDARVTPPAIPRGQIG